MKVPFFVLTAAALAGGCASDPSRYQNTLTVKLCVDYLSNNSRLSEALGRQSEMESELKRRGEDCSNPAYLSAAQAKAAAERPIDVNVRQKP